MNAKLSHQSRRAFSRDWIRQRKRSPRRLIFSTRSCLRYLNADLCFPTRYRAARFIGIKSNARGSRFCWARCFAVSARSNPSWVKYESLKHIDLYRVASSLFKIELFLPSATCLVVSLVVYSLSWCSHCIEIH